jgi:glucose-6-phosphate 1-dehydrogenase
MITNHSLSRESSRNLVELSLLDYMFQTIWVSNFVTVVEIEWKKPVERSKTC